jgi:hypothetical protein
LRLGNRSVRAASTPTWYDARAPPPDRTTANVASELGGTVRSQPLWLVVVGSVVRSDKHILAPTGFRGGGQDQQRPQSERLEALVGYLELGIGCWRPVYSDQ